MTMSLPNPHYHKDYVNYFKQIAQKNKAIKHSETDCRFEVIFQSAPPFDNLELEKWYDAHKSKIKNFPVLVLITSIGNFKQNNSSNRYKHIEGGFIILNKLRTLRNDEQEPDKIDQTERVAEQVISFMNKDMEDEIVMRYLTISDFTHEKVKDGTFVGTRINFTFGSRANDKLMFKPDDWLP